jgi:hypothetical protein
MKKTILIVPANDAEAAMILRLAKAINLPTIISGQPHGASLDKEPNIIKKVVASGAQKAVIVEMPGIKTEKQLLKKGIEVKIIDHHSYKGLNRKKNKSSLEQFLSIFNLDDQKIKDLSFEPKLVRGIAILDRGFVWALQKENYSQEEIKQVLVFRKKLMRPFIDPSEEKKYEQAAKEAWGKRQIWNNFIITSSRVKNGLRPFLSELIFKKFKKPIPLILNELGRNVILVQDSPEAERLFKEFGGFTFGDKGNWGYKNESGKPEVTLAKLKAFLEKKVIK